MRLTMRERHAVVNVTAKRYQQATKKERGRILDEFTALTRYRRSYAAWVLANWHRRKVFTVGRVRKIFVFGLKKPRPKGKNPAKRPPTYGADILRLIKHLWALSAGLCGKRLAPFIHQTLPILEAFEEIQINALQRQKLLSISPATIDRLLAPERNKYRLKGRATTRPGTLLKHQLPIRTFADWDQSRPGFVEVDLVAHDGGVPGPDVIHSLTLTDVATGWTEVRALKTKARRWVVEALTDIRAKLPFALLGIDTDNGSEFINEELLIYCRDHHLTFTRSRPYRKNDSCFVEQKNYSVVRHAVGYERFDNDQELTCLMELYQSLTLFTNYFLPSMKLLKKTRSGSKVTKHYDTPMTPFQRSLAHPNTDQPTKTRLQNQYEKLNPAELRRTISKIQDLLSSLAARGRYAKTQRKIIHLESISS